jgi:ABC-2 type transport system permease protein
MVERLKRMLVKEFLQMLRDPRMRFVVFVVPVMQMAVLAFCLTTDVTHIRTAVLDMDKSSASRELLSRFSSTGYFEIVAYVQSQRDFDHLLDRGTIRAAIHVPAGFEKDLTSGRTGRIQLFADGTDTVSASSIIAYANEIVAQYAAEKQSQRIAETFGASFVPSRIDLKSRSWFNPNLESKYYYVPGLITVMLMVVGMQLTSIAVVREKEIGTIEQVMVTPIRRVEFILGKTLPFLITGYIIMTLMLIIAIILFDLRVQGSWLLLYGLAGVYMSGNFGLALFISASASTQQQALLTAFFIMLPGVLLSGFMFPVRNMPVVVQWITLLNPMRWFLEIIRGVVLRGVGPSALWHAIAGQCVLALLFTSLATARFKKVLS